MKNFWNLGVLIVGALVSVDIFAATVESKSDNVPVLSTAEKNAATITTLKKGQQVTASERKGMYWAVTTAEGKKGFVSVLQVKAKSEASGLNEALRNSISEGRSKNGATESSRSRSAVMGVRGLDDNNTADAGSVRPNLRAVYNMEDRVVPRDQVDALGTEVSREVKVRERFKDKE